MKSGNFKVKQAQKEKKSFMMSLWCHHPTGAGASANGCSQENKHTYYSLSKLYSLYTLSLCIHWKINITILNSFTYWRYSICQTRGWAVSNTRLDLNLTSPTKQWLVSHSKDKEIEVLSNVTHKVMGIVKVFNADYLGQSSCSVPSTRLLPEIPQAPTQ